MTARWRPSMSIVLRRPPIRESRNGSSPCPRFPQVRLVLVTGRSARELHDLLRPGIRAEIWGSHGREQLRSDGTYELFALNPVQQAALDQVGLEMSALGFSETLEVKPTSLAIHWRSFEPAMQERIRIVGAIDFCPHRPARRTAPAALRWGFGGALDRSHEGNRGGGDSFPGAG